MFNSSFELTIAEIMREPTVRALMKADRVDPQEFEARLRLVAGGSRHAKEAETSNGKDAVPGRRFLPPILRAAIEQRFGC